MRWRDIYEVPIAYLVAFIIGAIVINELMRKIIREEYRRIGKIPYYAWYMHPVYCAKLKWGKQKD